MGTTALPTLPHLAVQEWILVPLVQLQQRVEAFAFGIVVPGAVPDGALDLHLGGFPRRRNVAQCVGQHGLAQPRRQPVPVVQPSAIQASRTS